MASKPHAILSLPFSTRAEDPSTPSLTTYLLSLISIKRSNLCVSADVHRTYELLKIAEEVGDYICVLKTHADIIDDFSDRTIKGLQEISRRKNFLLFEDRKLGDIGSSFPLSTLSILRYTMAQFQQRAQLTPHMYADTVQSQYTRGPLAIATWAHLTNAHLLPGPSIVPALFSAAQQALLSLNQTMETTISAGTPRTSLDSSRDPTESISTTEPATTSERSLSSGSLSPQPIFEHTRRTGRKGSETTATTTISQTFEYTAPRKPANLIRILSQGEDEPQDRATALEDLGPPPHARGLLLLAEMSSEGNLMTPEYTKACISAARSNKEFVLGFVAQKSLNQEPGDAFLSLAPGISLPAEGETSGVKSDGKGQKWRGPKEVIGKDGIDIVIVGRGILGAEDRAKEAERFRKASWEAYEGRIGRK